MPSSPRRFPPPWTAELQPNYYVVRDANRQQLITRMSLGGDPSEKRYQKTFPKINENLMHAP